MPYSSLNKFRTFIDPNDKGMSCKIYIRHNLYFKVDEKSTDRRKRKRGKSKRNRSSKISQYSRQKKKEDTIISQSKLELKKLGNVYSEVTCTEFIAPEIDSEKNKNLSGINWEEIVKN